MAEPLLAVRGLTKSYDGWSKALALAWVAAVQTRSG